MLTIIGSGSISLVALVALRTVAFDFAFAAGIFVSTTLSLLTRGFRWLVLLGTVGSGSTGVVAAAFVRALVALVVVKGWVIIVLVAAVDLLAMVSE